MFFVLFLKPILFFEMSDSWTKLTCPVTHFSTEKSTSYIVGLGIPVVVVGPYTWESDNTNSNNYNNNNNNNSNNNIINFI